jgi:hypothetical protein
MKSKTQTKTEQMLIVLHILAWLAFVGLMIQCAAILISYTVSYSNPAGARNLYNGLNLYDLRQFNFWYYTGAVSYMVVLLVLKTLVVFQVIKILSKFNLKNPFTLEVAGRLEKISYIALGTWVVTLLSNVYLGWLQKITGKLFGNQLSGEFIFMVGLVFIIAQVFKRGVEIQSENDLTV